MVDGARFPSMHSLVAGQIIRTPAKVNLFLRVLRRRRDGYHLLESLIVPIGLFDVLHIRAFEARGAGEPAEIHVTANLSDIPEGQGNLVGRAAQVFSLATQVGFELSVYIEKHIPTGAGLGGGSSDAASILRALNRTFAGVLDATALQQLALRLGADVPFFLAPEPAIVSGVGENVEPYREPIPAHLVLCGDGVPLATRAVFERYAEIALTTNIARSSVADPADAGDGSARYFNHLERAAAQLHPNILTMKRELVRRGASAAVMSGSGSVVVGIAEDEESAQQLAKELRALGYWSEAVRSLVEPDQ